MLEQTTELRNNNIIVLITATRCYNGLYGGGGEGVKLLWVYQFDFGTTLTNRQPKIRLGVSSRLGKKGYSSWCRLERRN